MPNMDEIGLFRQNMAALSRRAATDKEFRLLCLDDASKAYLELTGQAPPEWHAARFFEPAPGAQPDGAGAWLRLPPYLAETWLY